jgi:hypothetical protein
MRSGRLSTIKCATINREAIVYLINSTWFVSFFLFKPVIAVYGSIISMRWALWERDLSAAWLELLIVSLLSERRTPKNYSRGDLFVLRNAQKNFPSHTPSSFTLYLYAAWSLFSNNSLMCVFEFHKSSVTNKHVMLRSASERHLTNLFAHEFTLTPGCTLHFP